MSASAAPNAMTELKVSAHLMTLEGGVFCVFNTPGGPPPDAATGLPGVRLSAAPAAGPQAGTVTINGFGSDGWLGGPDGAALVRVSGNPAQVLVTVYQDPKSQHEAPKLQVLRLTEGVPSPVAVAAPAPAPEPIEQFEVAAHVYGRGDVDGRMGEWMGERGSKRWIEGFGLMPSGGLALSDVEYQAVLGRGWLSPWAEGGQFCGSRGMSLPILGLRVRLKGAAAGTHTVAVSATFVDGTEIGPVQDGEPCEAPSLSPLESFRIVFSPIGVAQPRKGRRAAEQPAPAPAPQAKPRAKPVPAAAPQPLARQAKPAAKVSTKPGPKPGSKRGAAAKTVAATAPVQPAAPKPAKPAKPAKRTPATTRRR